MYKSISYWSFLPVNGAPCPPDQAIKLAKAAGYDAVELCIDLGGGVNPETTQAQCEDWRAAADKVGIRLDSCASGMSWGCSPTHLDKEVRKKFIGLQKAAVQRTAWLGAKTLLHVPGAVIIPWDPEYKPVPYDKAVQWAREAIDEVGAYAASLNIELAVENVWNGMFYSPLELASFVDSFKNPFLGVYFDIGNIVNHQQWVPHWIEILGKRIKRVHVKDFKLSVGTLEGFCELLDGDVPWKETMDALRAIGYDRTMTAEMIPPNADTLVRTSKALDKILAM